MNDDTRMTLKVIGWTVKNGRRVPIYQAPPMSWRCPTCGKNGCKGDCREG